MVVGNRGDLVCSGFLFFIMGHSVLIHINLGYSVNSNQTAKD